MRMSPIVGLLFAQILMTSSALAEEIKAFTFSPQDGSELRLELSAEQEGADIEVIDWACESETQARKANVSEAIKQSLQSERLSRFLRAAIEEDRAGLNQTLAFIQKEFSFLPLAPERASTLAKDLAGVEDSISHFGYQVPQDLIQIRLEQGTETAVQLQRCLNRRELNTILSKWQAAASDLAAALTEFSAARKISKE